MLAGKSTNNSLSSEESWERANMSDYIAVLTSLIGLFTAWVTYQATVKRSIAKAEQRTRVLAINDPTVSVEYWKPRRMLLIQGLIGVVYILTVSVLLPATLIPALVGALVGVGIGMLVVLLVRKTPPSRVLKSASIVVSEAKGQAVSRCLDALQKMGARIARVDQESGIVQARMPMSVWSVGNIVDISVVSNKSDQSEIRVSSDSILPSTMVDFGANTRIVRRIISQFL